MDVMKRVAILGTARKGGVAPVLHRLDEWLRRRAKVVFSAVTDDASQLVQHAPQMVFVLGGDGTLITAAQALAALGIPIVGVNLGKIGFLAEFSVEELEREGDFLFAGDAPATRRILLDVKLQPESGTPRRGLAVNDCVIVAGPPHRMIELAIWADEESVAEVRSDGLIISTPTGSTAHNLSSGGPILEPTAESIILTPICPHALTFRPLVLAANHVVTVQATKVNEGSAMLVDGRLTGPLGRGDRVTLARSEHELLLVRNPRRSSWYALRRKLLWGEAPKNG